MGFIDYLRDTRGELRHVTWPTKQQAVGYTMIVLLVSVGTGLFLGLLDFLFKEGISRILGL